MSKYYALFLLACLSAPFAGTYTWLRVEKHRVRHAVKAQILAGMTKEDLVKLSFSRAGAIAQLRWEHPGEVEYRGEMYDVAHRETTTDSLHLWCVPDKRETALNRQINGLLARGIPDTPATHDVHNKYDGFLESLFWHAPTRWRLALPEQKPPPAIPYAFHWDNMHPPTLHPPPRPFLPNKTA